METLAGNPKIKHQRSNHKRQIKSEAQTPNVRSEIRTKYNFKYQIKNLKFERNNKLQTVNFQTTSSCIFLYKCLEGIYSDHLFGNEPFCVRHPDHFAEHGMPAYDGVQEAGR